MKKRILIALFSFVLIFLFSLSNYNFRTFIEAKIMFTLDCKHERTKTNPAVFDYKRIRIGKVFVCFEKSIYEEEKARIIVDKIQEDMAKLKKISGEVKAADIYVMPTNYKKCSETKQELTTTYKDVISGEYLAYYLESTGMVSGYWRALSVESLVRDEKVKGKRIKKALKDKDINFYPLYLDKHLNKSFRVYQDLAVAYGMWLYDKYGWDSLQDNKGDELNKFCDEYGYNIKKISVVRNKQIINYNLSNIDECKIYDEDYTIMYPSNYNGNIKDDVIAFEDYLVAKNAMEKMIVNDFPMLKKKVLNPKKVTFKYRNTGDNCYAKTDLREVNLVVGVASDVILHEMVHIHTIGRDAYYKDNISWLEEGLAEFYAAKVKMPKSEAKFVIQKRVQEFDSKSEQAKENFEQIKKVYEGLAGRTFNKENLNAYNWEKAIAIVSLQDEGMKKINDTKAYYVESVMKTRIGEEGNNVLEGLTYPEAMLMVEYIFKKYGISMVKEIMYTPKDVEEVLGYCEEQFYLDFVEWVKSNYLLNHFVQ